MVVLSCSALRNLLLALTVPMMISAQTGPAPADGVWSHGNTVILLARFNSCDLPYHPIQPLESIDGGATWHTNGPRLVGSEWKYFYDAGSELWIAGEEYAEGPTHAPFLLTRPANGNWERFEIYADSAELLNIGFEKNSGRLLAWVRHLDDLGGNSKSPVYLHQSVDRGRTWTVLREVTAKEVTGKSVAMFGSLPRRSGDWRLTNDGSTLERRDNAQTWSNVRSLPLPLQQQCGKQP